MFNYDYITPMTIEEQKEALSLLKQSIKEGKITFNHANPIEQNCYISSSSIEGIYFPNTEFNVIENILQFVCLAKYKGEFGIVFEYTEEFKERRTRKFNLEDYDFTSFDYFLYTYEERQLKEQICKEKKELEKDLKVINSIVYQLKKDGKPFAKLKDNIQYETESKKVSMFRDWLGYVKISLVERSKAFNNYVEYKTLYNGEDLEELKKHIEQHKNYCINQIKIYEKELKNLHKIYEDIKKIKDIYNKYSSVTRTKLKELIY